MQYIFDAFSSTLQLKAIQSQSGVNWLHDKVLFMQKEKKKKKKRKKEKKTWIVNICRKLAKFVYDNQIA